MTYQPRVHEVVGLRSAKPCEPVLPPPNAAAQAAGRAKGLRYEKAVIRHLAARWPEAVPNQWFAYEDSTGPHVCQTDVVVPLRDRVLVFEAKSGHRSLAYVQLRRLYGPVVERVYGLPSVQVEITRSYDPATPWPERPYLMFSMSEWDIWASALNPERSPRHLGVLVWKPGD